MIRTPSYLNRPEPKSLPLTDPRFPGLRFVKGNPKLKKTDPGHKDRIITDDELNGFDIFAPTPDPALLQQGRQVELIDIQPFDEYCQRVMLLDMEWVGFDGGPANGDHTDVIVAIGCVQNGHFAIACNKAKTEKELLQWFLQLLDKWNPHTIGGHAIYGFFKGDREILSDLGLLAARLKHHGLYSSTLLLSTAHGSKGLEADSVIVLGWDKFVTMDPTDWQLKRFTPEEIEQEQHLSYVAGTRAKHDLCFAISSEVEYAYGNMEVAA